MADDPTTRPPALPSTADAVPYAPVSWMAVAAVGVTALFVLILLVTGVDAFRNKKPLIMPEVLFLPVVAIVLAFAARRMIRNSEGTRVGEDLANAAWWTSLVLLLVYAAYLFAINYSIRRDAEAEVNRWIGFVLEGDEVRAFDRTLPAKSRVGGDAAKMRSRYPQELLAFSLTDLFRVAARNKGANTFTPVGLRDWKYQPWGIECIFTGELTCPEGTFPVAIPMKAMETGLTGADAAAGRQWQIVMNPGQGFLQPDRIARTRYGWYVEALERQGSKVGREFVQRATYAPGMQFEAYFKYAHPEDRERYMALVANVTSARLAAVGPLAVRLPLPAELFAETADRLFTLTKPNPTEEDRKKLRAVWLLTGEGRGLIPSGVRLRIAGEQAELIAVTDAAVEVRVPAEVVVPGDESSAARARVVVATSDPGLMEALRKARANPGDPLAAPPDEVKRDFPGWKVLRVETDLAPVRLAPPGGRDAPGGPGG